ncbi:MAG: hypothetical protein IKC53_06565, partial [Lentisphaeria bacterium]|nr:hypothetical protein [Lentisphaeria bacterium]
AESYTGKNENHKLFERLVHITPSLSSFVLMRTFLAAYNRIRMVSIPFLTKNIVILERVEFDG